MDYSKELIENYKKKQAIIQAQMNANGIFPNRKNPLKPLSQREELLLKVTYKFKVAFLEEMEFLFSQICTKASVEKMVIDLEEQGYLSSTVSKDLGKCWVLTDYALYYITTDRSKTFNEVNITAPKIPVSSKLMLFKCVNADICYRVFNLMTMDLYNHYKMISKEEKRAYQQRQYIEQFVLSDDEKRLGRTNKNIIIDNYLTMKEPTRDNDEAYARFIKFLKTEADTVHLFNFLKSFYASPECNELRLNAVQRTYTVLASLPTNVFTDNKTSFRSFLYNTTGFNEHLNEEYKLFLINEYLKQFSIAKRNLYNIKLEDKTDDYKTLVQKRLNDLEASIAEYEKLKDKFTDDFLAMLYDKQDISDAAVYREEVVTLETLRNSNIFITNATNSTGAKPNIEFTIYQPSFDELTVAYLFSKIDKIFHFYYKTIFNCDYSIRIVVYDEANRKAVAGKIATLIEQFSSIPEYALLIPVVQELAIESCERHFKERYEVYKEMAIKV